MYEEYYEPTEIEEKIEELKELIVNEAKNEVSSHVKYLESKVSEMQKKCDEYDTLKKQYEVLEEKHKEEIEKLKNDLIENIMGDLVKPLYVVRKKIIGMAPKCDKCDADRKLWYTTPRGKREYEYCECKKDIFKYVVLETEDKELSGKLLNGYPNIKSVKINSVDWVNVNSMHIGENMNLQDNINKCKYGGIYHESDWKYDLQDVIFRTKECAQEWADKSNEIFKCV